MHPLPPKKLEKNMTEQLLLSVKDACTFLSMSRATFWRRVHDGTFPQPIRIAGITRWRRDDLIKAIDRAAEMSAQAD